MYGDNLTMGDAFTITIFSMLLVFSALVIISYFIDLVAMLVNRKKQAEVVPAAPAVAVEETVEESDDQELIAVIAAAVAATSGKSLDSFIVRSARRIENVKSPWAQAALRDLMK